MKRDQRNQPPLIASVFTTLFNLPRVLANPVFGVFQPFEQKILALLKAELGPDDASILESQLVPVNLVKCVTAKSSEINLFRATIAGINLEREKYFDGDEPHFILAKLRIRIDGERVARVGIHVVNGVVFSLDFDIDVRPYRKSSNIELLSIQLKNKSGATG